jgi:hypothetical protein
MFRKTKEPTSFDFVGTVNAAIRQALQNGMSRRIVIERLEQIVAAQERTEATAYRSSMLPPIMFDAVTMRPRT